MTDKLLEVANEFKPGDQVFVYTKPAWSSCPETSPIWQCTVSSVEATRVVEIFDDEQKETIEVKLKLSCGFDSFTRKSTEVFTELEAAKEYGLKQLDELLKERSKFDSKIAMASDELKKQEVSEW